MKKNTTKLLILISLLLCSVGMLFMLSATTSKLNHQYNSFFRNFLDSMVHFSNVLDIQYNSFYLAGATSNNIYFGNVRNPWHLIKANKKLIDTLHIELGTEGQDQFEFQTVKVTVDSPFFYFIEPSIPNIFRGNINDWFGQLQVYDKKPFLESQPISQSSLAIRMIDTQTNEFILAKKMNFHPRIELGLGLLEKQIDGRFCTDGILHFSKDLSLLVYVYFYRNQFIVADTNLNLHYRGNTIDPISRAKITVAEIKSDKSMTLSSPPLLVNRKSCVSDNFLFINSNLLAKNENKNKFENSSVIDIYNLEEGEYKFSFYLPKHKGKQMREFKVFGNILIALYDHYVLRYEINLNYLSLIDLSKPHMHERSNIIPKKNFPLTGNPNLHMNFVCYRF